MRAACLWRVIMVLLLCGAAAGVLVASDAAPAPLSLEPRSIDRFLAQAVTDKGLVGLSVAVVRDGQVVYADGVGLARFPGGPRAGRTTRFAIGSTSKQFTSASILLLAEEGKLSVADPVAKWFPELTRAADITLLDLMNMVAGYPEYAAMEFVTREMQQPQPPATVVRRYATRPLEFEPGTRFQYSNTNYLILGQVVERVSGETQATFLERRIFKRLGMRHSVFEPAAQDRRYAQGHVTCFLEPPRPALSFARGWADAAGGIYSTAADLTRWNLALMDGTLLKPETYTLMASPRKLADGSLSKYGCGLIGGEWNGAKIIAHGGSVPGFHAQNTMIPARRAAVTVLSNFSNYDANRAIFASLLNAVVPPPPQAAAESVPPRTLALVPGDLPTISGPSADEAARRLFLAMQAGAVDRTGLGEEFSHFLTDARLAEAAPRLAALGQPTRIDIEATVERGGMEQTNLRLHFAGANLKALMYRTPDGKVQQLFVYRE